VTVRSVYLTTSCIGREQALCGFPANGGFQRPRIAPISQRTGPKLPGDDDTGM
jgi:hypothetical protein